MKMKRFIKREAASKANVLRCLDGMIDYAKAHNNQIRDIDVQTFVDSPSRPLPEDIFNYAVKKLAENGIEVIERESVDSSKWWEDERNYRGAKKNKLNKNIEKTAYTYYTKAQRKEWTENRKPGETIDEYFKRASDDVDEYAANYTPEPDDDDWDFNKEYNRKKKQFYSWDKLTDKEKSDMLKNGQDFLDRITNKYLERAVSDIKDFIENQMNCEFVLNESKVNVGYVNNDFKLDMIINFDVLDENFDDGSKEVYSYETTNGKLVKFENFANANEVDEMYSKMIPAAVSEAVKITYKAMLSAIEDDFKEHVYTDKEKRLKTRVSNIIRGHLRRLSSKR